MYNTQPKEGHWKFQGDEGSQKTKFFKRKYEAKLEFLEGWEGSIQKNLLWGGGGGVGYGYFLEPHILC